ncbi:MAG TPA: chromosome segregation protein SMC [Acetobacteraceae bacterium]|nr:chromosome segregation protein SMC [Acetobacteraceae bacterium]
MPVSFARLRIVGFKSFAEATQVEILPGLTGIVGPNGCGKSNVVEALRWGMGETSARSLRGGEMDDVIFAGTTARPSRNIAEVALLLQGAAGVAPPPFSELDEIEILRRIERGSGSEYRVNGREVRARDVQTLFADLASGARASAMVSQGRVGALVAARPEERRTVLEEAAGITGLHARRHEAELKLRQAEANLARAEDAKGQLEAQLAGLKRQARQASRYRNLSGAIRAVESELLAIQLALAERTRVAAHAALAAAREAAGVSAEAARGARTRADELVAGLPALRETEAEARTALERARVAGEQLAADEARARSALAELERRLDQLGRDIAHAEQAGRDAADAEARLEAERARLAQAAEAHPARAEAAQAEALATAEAAREAEQAANRATEAAAEAAARAQAAAQMLAQAEARARRAEDGLARANAERDRLRAQIVDPARLDAAEAERVAAEQAAEAARAAQEAAEHARPAAQAALAEARARLAAAEAARAKLAAEARALAEVLAVKDGERWPPMIDGLTVPPGLEAALGAALGEELSSAADPDAPRHWRELPPLDPVPELPQGARRLADLVQGPAALARVLSQTGLVEDEAAGDAAQAALRPGQVLVSSKGAVWRWDGYAIRAGTPTAAAVRLQQRNRLTGLKGELARGEEEATEALAERSAAEARERAAQEAEQAARAARREAEQRLDRARHEAAQLKAQAESAAARLAAAEQQVAALAPEREEATEALAEARQAQVGLPDLAVLRTAVEETRGALARARAAEGAARSAAEALAREQAGRLMRLEAIARELEDWRQRAADAAGRLTDLRARLAEAAAERGPLAEAPGRAAAARAAAESVLLAARDSHRRAAEALSSATEASEGAERAARAAEAAQAEAREAAIRAEAEAQRADHAWGLVAERVLERLGPNPALPEPPEPCGAEEEEAGRRKLERLLKERDGMGPVNLRADIEAEEVERQIAAIEAERAEIGTAIAKLRGSIGHLNREGRERLSLVFEEVDRQFQALFARMFGGGRAHLALVGSDDPLEAGLEIYAQPPGKKLATLSLLSGGEQALTALSLIFAVFRCNPAPICVLDEVDAPLDDVNVERFCALLDDMVRETGTRFLVVTHSPLTMARMDRLYGVTMQERGVSRLLSVDLQAAERMVEPQRLAAD